ncbi:autotransporter assembly complex protein TamA, partial [Rhodovulum adriaticum]
MTESILRRAAALVLILVLAGMAAPSWATEARLSAPGAGQALKRALKDASLSLAAARRAEASAQEILAAARADYGRLVGVLYDRGRFGPVIHIRLDGREAADLAPLALSGRPARLEITVDPGPAFTLGRAEIGPLAPRTELPEGFAPGRPAQTGVIRQAAAAGVAGWRSAGHAKARIGAQDLSADHRRQRLDARLRLAPGPAVTFGRLRIEGESAVRPERLRAIAGLPEGARFTPEALERSADRLRRTGAFRSVRLSEAETLGPGDNMDVVLTVTDSRPRRLGLGAELSSLEGMTLTGFWLHRNLLGGAERLRFDGAIEGIGAGAGDGVDYRLSTRLERPAITGPDTGGYLTAELETLDEPDFREESVSLGAGLTHVFSRLLSGEAGLTLRHSAVRDDLGRRDMTHLLVPAALTWDRRDDQLNPGEGFFLQAGAMPLLALGGAAENGFRLTGDARIYQGLGERTVLAARLQFGAITGATTAGVPPDLLFFSGGGGT